MNEFTPEQIARLAEYYHERECPYNHTDGCGWFWEKGANYPPDRKWDHARWEKRVPALVERDRKKAAEVELIAGSLDEIKRLRSALQLVVDQLEEGFPKSAQQFAMDALGEHLKEARRER